MKLLMILNYHTKITSVQEITSKFMATNIPQNREGTVSVNTKLRVNMQSDTSLQ